MLKNVRSLLTAAATALIVAGPASAEIELPVWSPSDGAELNFEVLRKGKPFGYHRLQFDQSGDALTVTNDIELKVKVGPFTPFYYKHDSTETWMNGQLKSLDAETRKDGDDLVVDANYEDGRLVVDGTKYSGELPGDLIPSSHWNIEQIRSQAILSSEGGQKLPIEVTELGTETIVAGGKEITATRFRMESDITVDLWYDSEGRWVKCSFEARDQLIEYVLQ